MQTTSGARIWCAILLIFLSADVFTAAAQVRHAESLPDFDHRGKSPKTLTGPTAQQTAAADALQAQVPALRVDFDPITGSPRTVSSWRTFLTGPNGASQSGAVRSTAAVVNADPDRPTKTFLDEHRDLFGHGSEALTNARVTRVDVTTRNGLRTVVWQQQAAGVRVFEAVLQSHTTSRGELVNIASQFLPDLAAAVGDQSSSPALTAPQAISAAAKNIGDQISESEIIPTGPPDPGAEQKQRFKSASLVGESSASLVWVPVNRGELRLCWDVMLTSRARNEMFRVLVDAGSGEVLIRRGLTRYISAASYNVFTSDSPSPFSPGYATPNPVQPALTNRTLVTWSALDTNASPGGWLNDGVTQTLGNNVDAHTDRNADDVADLPRPTSPTRVFDFPMDLSAQDPTNYSQAAVVQLFYECNWMHDRLYELGFTESAGNFQTDNFGRGGLGNDPVQADAQDGSGTDNANFATPTDGSSPRMQMYIFTGSSPRRDGDFDAEVMLHEYTHGLSHRLVGGGVGISALQTDGMGEGWSDFYALSLLSAAGDDVNGVYACAAYASYELGGVGDQQNYYFGIRRYPYTTDMSKNPLTLNDIDPAQADFCSSSAPYHTALAGTCSGADADEVHNQGEVWCVTLWGARANIITRYGWTTGNLLMLQLVTDGMKLSPVNPTFLEARDGILQADLVDNGGTNQADLWAAFAKRGMGVNATSPVSSTTAGVVEAFNVPDTLQITPGTGFVSSGPVNGPFNVTNKTYTLTNIGPATLNWSIVNTSSWLNVSPAGGSLTPGAGSVAMQVSLTAAASLLGKGVYPATVLVSNQTSGVVQFLSYTLRVGQTDNFTEPFLSGSSALDFQSWLFTPDSSQSFYSACRTVVAAFPTDPTGGTLVSLADDNFIPETLTGTNTVAVYNRRTNVFFIGSNGYLTLGAGDASNTETPANHFALSRVAGMLDDLNPSVGGTVSWQQLSNRAVVTFQSVPEYGIVNANSFQMELFFDGRIRITYLHTDATSGILGLSAGTGTPANFVASDFTTFTTCPIPLVLQMPGETTEGAGTVPASVQIPQALAADLPVALVSFNTNKITVPAGTVITAGQTNTSFNLTVVNNAVLDGAQSATLQASAAGYGTGQATILVDDDETAVLHVKLPASASESSGSVTGVVSCSAAPVSPVAVLLSSGDTTKVTVPAFVSLPAGQTSAVFNATIIDNFKSGSPQTIGITGHVQNWTDGLGTMLFLLDDATNTLGFGNPGFITINDNASASPYPSAITVSNVAGSVVKVTATLSNMFHTYPADLDILLVGPTGTNVMLMSDAGGGNDLVGYTLIFDDTGTNILPSAGSIVPGTYHTTNYTAGDPMPAPAPVSTFGNSLADFNGQNPNGVWKLFVVDDATADTGNISNGWSLQFSVTSASVGAAPNFLPPFFNAGQVKLQFPSLNGQGYTMQYKSTITDALWQTFQSVTGNGSVLTVPDTPSNQTRFFRLSMP